MATHGSTHAPFCDLESGRHWRAPKGDVEVPLGRKNYRVRYIYILLGRMYGVMKFLLGRVNLGDGEKCYPKLEKKIFRLMCCLVKGS